MRGYFFVNALYMKEIQWGIQSLHTVADMFVAYPENSKPGSLLYDWATSHKTAILLNGGNHFALNELYLGIVRSAIEEGYPIMSFQEDEQSLNRATTCVGLILPTHLCDVIDEFVKQKPQFKQLASTEWFLSEPLTHPLLGKLFKYNDYLLTTIVSSYGLAR